VNWAASYLTALGGLVAELWLYLLLGFLMAGIIAEFVPKRTLLRYCGTNNLATYGRAMAAGLVVSLCSCGAIPIAATMRAKGATRAAALTFLAAAPWAGFLQLLIFYRFLGFARTAIVFVGAMLVAFLTGWLLGKLEDAGWLDGTSRSAIPLAVADEEAEHHAERMSQRWVCVFREAGEAFRELWKYLAFGLLVAAALRAFVPSEWVNRYLGAGSAINPVLLAVPVAAVVELCSEGFSVLAGQLYQLGASLAVVFVVVLVGVTTDFTELSMIWGKFGKRCALGYLGIATALTIALGFLIQLVFP